MLPFLHRIRPIIVFGDRFVEPFSDLIHSWEKTLSLIYEIIDQWVNFTQRKWLYLEGIFVANDARIKLPTIADKFDLIDAEYIKVYTEKNKNKNQLPFSCVYWFCASNENEQTKSSGGTNHLLISYSLYVFVCTRWRYRYWRNRLRVQV